MTVTELHVSSLLHICAAYGVVDIAERSGNYAATVAWNRGIAEFGGIDLRHMARCVIDDARSARWDWTGLEEEEAAGSDPAQDYLRLEKWARPKQKKPKGLPIPDSAPVRRTTIWLGSGQSTILGTAITLRDIASNASVDSMAASLVGRGSANCTARKTSLRLSPSDAYSGAYRFHGSLSKHPRPVDPLLQWLAWCGWSVIGFVPGRHLLLPVPSYPSTASWLRRLSCAAKSAIISDGLWAMSTIDLPRPREHAWCSVSITRSQHGTGSALASPAIVVDDRPRKAAEPRNRIADLAEQRRRGEASARAIAATRGRLEHARHERAAVHQ